MQTQDKHQNVFIRRAQSSRDGFLYLNLPSEWTTIVDLQKSDTLKCSIVHSIIDNDFFLEAASTLVYDNRIRKSLLISSIGIAILFGTLEISPLQYHVYPPYGFITQAFIPLGTYLLFVGIFTSARNISRDAELRKEFYKNASSQLALLRSIGVSQMEREIEKEVKSIEKRLQETAAESHLEEQHLDEENVKEILHDVLNELYYSKSKEERPNHNNRR
jgi:hypothetical protein